MKRSIEIWLMAMAAVMMLTGCYDHDYDEVAISGDPIRVEMTYTFSSSAAGNRTRQSDVVVQNTVNRIPTSLRIIALEDQNPTNSSIVLESPVNKDNPTARFYRSQSCEMEQGVNGCIVYGAVENVNNTISGSVNPKVFNGSLSLVAPQHTDNTPPDIVTLPINSVDDLTNIKFTLESIVAQNIIDQGSPEEARKAAGYLTDVANVYIVEGGRTLYWKNSKNDILKNLFINFTNHENNLPGSEAAIKKWLEILKEAVDDYYASSLPSLGSEGSEERKILSAISSMAETKISAIGTVEDTSYPRSLHLPDGAAVLRWVRSTTNGDAFQPRMNNTTLDNINGVSRFAYPAALYYFVDSNLKTSNNVVSYYTTNFEGVTSDTETTAWDKVLEAFEYDNASITSSTKSVALKKPVQYAVAQLHLTVKAATATLEDATTPTPKTVMVGTSNNFPLTGVIVSGQRPVDYRFEPVNSDVDAKFIYDSQVKKSDNSYYYMTTNEPTGGPNTLVLQTRSLEDVFIILEFENNSGTDFEGVNGTVYAGTRFYLIGKVAALTESQIISSQEYTKQVFTKDYITNVNMTVKSLAKAYSVLPNLLKNNLEIGVEATPQWVAATPTVIRLE